MQLNPLLHAELVTGRRQSAVIDLWSTTGFAAAISEVTGPHLYEFGELPVPTIAITLYDVRRHVLIENGQVRRDAPVAAGRFRIGQPRCSVVVDAVPRVRSGNLLLLYLGDRLLKEVGAARGFGHPIELMDLAWETEDSLLALSAHRLVQTGPQNSPNALLAEQLAYTLALHLTDRYAAPRIRRPQDAPTFDEKVRRRVAEFVQADPGATITLTAMAKIAEMSVASFIQSFKRSTGLTPHRFVIEQRILAARHLLATSDMPVAEVALVVGFSSQSHFGATFRAITDLSPALYRRLQHVKK